MTRNQKRAIALAGEIRGGTVDPDRLPEIEWHLLLLAADTNRTFAPAKLVASRVLERAQRGIGYFARSPSPHTEVAFLARLKAGLVAVDRENPYGEIGAALTG